MDKFDCIVIGGGWGGIAFALLYAMSGKKTALFEYNDRLGGYGHCFEREGYKFCANMHYFFDTHPGGKVDQFLKRVNLENKINFNSLDKDGFDNIKIDDYNFSIPLDLESYRNKLIINFPDNRDSINQLFKIRYDIELITNLYVLEEQLFFTIILNNPIEFFNFAKYFLRSASSVLDHLNIEGNLRAILLSRLGNFGVPSSEVPLILLLLEMTAYTRCATFPENGMSDFIDKIQEKLIKNNVSIFLNNEVKKINCNSRKQISSILDQNGNEYVANLYISNLDPQLLLELCDYPVTKKYCYKYTYSCFSLYLGLKDIKLEDYSLGNFNTWYYPTNDIDLDCDAALNQLDFIHSFLFISTPSAHVKSGILSPPGCHTMQIVVPADYHTIAKIHENAPHKYEELNEQVKNQILNTLDERFIPNIREYIEIEELWSPVDLAKKVKTPCGAMYGMRPNWRKVIWPLGHKTPFSNLYSVGASATYAGLAPVLSGAMKLFDKLKDR